MDNSDALATLSEEASLSYDNIMDILNDMEEIVMNSSRVVFSSRSYIDPEQFLDLINELRNELSSALFISDRIVENNKILNKAEKTSTAVPYDVKVEAKKLLEKAISLAEEETE